MRCLVTGGAGFIGRWLIKALLDRGYEVSVIDDLSSGSLDNLRELQHRKNFLRFVRGNIIEKSLLDELFQNKVDICFHLAAQINVQNSIDDPARTFTNDVMGSFSVLQCCRECGVKLVFTSSCMVYEKADTLESIKENSETKPASPYAAAKLASEALILSYYHSYGLPVIVARPFNTYGPHQRADGEGGVIPIFIKRRLENQDLLIYGDGSQTRDFLYVEDCAEFLVRCGENNSVCGKIINAGTGSDVSMNALALMISGDDKRIRHVPHIHPQSEIQKLCCNSEMAQNALSWSPRVSLAEGIARTSQWISAQLTGGSSGAL